MSFRCHSGGNAAVPGAPQAACPQPGAAAGPVTSARGRRRPGPRLHAPPQGPPPQRGAAPLRHPLLPAEAAGFPRVPPPAAPPPGPFAPPPHLEVRVGADHVPRRLGQVDPLTVNQQWHLGERPSPAAAPLFLLRAGAGVAAPRRALGNRGGGKLRGSGAGRRGSARAQGPGRPRSGRRPLENMSGHVTA